jgi:hypothetical protein
VGHSIRWGIDPTADGPVRKHAYQGDTEPEPDVVTYCGITIFPAPLDQIPIEHRYVARCRDCRLATWEEVNKGVPYPSQA